jgi:PEP-CTERM motif
MRNVILGAVGAAALALASAASAAVVVTGSTGLNHPDPATAGSVVVNGGLTTINFGQQPLTDPFSGSFTFTNTVADFYQIIIGSSTPGVTFSSASLSDGVSTFALHNFPDNTQLKLDNMFLGAGNYLFSFAGGGTVGGTLTGNVTISAVPEPGTWGLMIIGFGAIGLTMSRRRRPVLAQVA